MTPIPPTRRGACPAFLAPMETGDGLILRLVPADGRLSPAQLRGLAAAARRLGNGMMEVTARGSLQVRGLTAESVPLLQDAVLALGITPRLGLAVDVSPLGGIDPSESADGHKLAAEIIAGAQPLAGKLGPKVSVVVEGGGAVSLAGQKADVRLVATGPGQWALTVGNAPARVLPEADAAAEALAALVSIAALGRAARAADLPGCGGRARGAEAAPPLGRLPLADGTLAFGFGLPFGAGDAAQFEAIADALDAAGARDVRPAPERTLIATGLSAGAADVFAARLAALGCITAVGDPRARVAACAGAPACASAHIPARALAPVLAEAFAPLMDGTVSLHLSACTKGCAHPAPASLAFVGMDGGVALVHDGPASGAARPVRLVADFPAAVASLAATLAARRAPGETTRALLARLDPAGLWADGAMNRRAGKDHVTSRAE
ncbi:precorrin-3B synthase [Xanthobacter flavus]|uniref:Precorrin-3B synthase n=1 Tax=Xanthobacter flavus TaxID=281 RepID=A0A9W6FJR3_XANFL|nr:precorrin-3B synthase [Xanthobacter flavus]MDR6334260.1 precorrin-3B synthase [Xanthobacter flavus]GLI22979.1 precorrin-3B synthase [Xanthobacter flavus]